MIAAVLLSISGGNSISAGDSEGMHYAAGRGYGIFQTMHYTDRVNDPAKNIDSPYLSGAEFIYTWAELEPSEGKFRWDIIDTPMAPWVKKGKRIILSFRTVVPKGKGPTQKSATPSWVYNAGAQGIEFKNTNWPIYWNKVFLEKYEGFIKALASRYDGSDNIEFIIIGLGEFGTTKITRKKKIFLEYQRQGYTEKLWTDTIMEIIKIYKRHFKKTPLAVTLSPFYRYGDKSESSIYTIVKEVAEMGIYLYNHTLSGKTDFAKNPFIPMYDKFYKKTEIILGPDNPIISNTDKYGNIENVVENAFGGLKGMLLTHIKYLIFYPADISAATKGSAIYDMTFESAIKKASERLISENLKKNR